jgi:hypothetical protein
LLRDLKPGENRKVLLEKCRAGLQKKISLRVDAKLVEMMKQCSEQQ